MTISDIIDGARCIISDVTRQSIENYCHEQVEEARVNQEDQDIEHAVEAFLELGADDIKTMDLLQKYYGIENISDAKRYISEAKFHKQNKAFKQYLKSRNIDSRHYYKENDVVRKIKNTPKYLQMSPEKLKNAIEKD